MKDKSTQMPAGVGGTTVATGLTAGTFTTQNKDLNAYFNSKRAGVDGKLVERLVQFIDGATKTLDCAIYDLRDPDILAALARAAKRGKVRIAYDGSPSKSGGPIADPKPNGTAAAIQQAGLTAHATPVHVTGRHLMHDKFLIRDREAVWTGSANFTLGGLTLQDNVCLEFRSPALAARYQPVFDDLLTSPPATTTDTTQPIQIDPGTSIETHFAPDSGEGIEVSIAKALAVATKVRVMAFLVSDPGILQALAKFKPSAADIRGVYDPNGMKDGMKAKNIDPSLFWFTQDSRFVAAPSHAFHPGGEQDFMHVKSMVLDDNLTITGSYNFSENAEANEENILFVRSPALAGAFERYFDALFQKYK